MNDSEERYSPDLAQRLSESDEALRKSEERFRLEQSRGEQYLDTAEVILLALDMDGRITLVNRYACAVLGWTRDELLGQNWRDLCLPDRIREEIKKKFHAVIAGDVSIVENPLRTRSGEERLIEWRNRPLRDEEGHIVGTLSSGTDITERNQAVEALRRTEERMRFALQSANVGIWDMDHTAGVLVWSEISEAHYGLQPGTFGGTFEEFVEHIHPADREAMLDTIGRAMKLGCDFSVLHRSIWPDGSIRWLSGAGRVFLGEQGEPVRAVGITQDVTERKQAEAEFKRLNAEIHLQRLRVFKATMRTVQDIVNNLLNGLQLVHLEAEDQSAAQIQMAVDQMIREAALKLKTLGDLETVKEKEMAGGVEIDYSNRGFDGSAMS